MARAPDTVVQSRTARQTGTEVEVIFELDGLAGWWNLCVPHGGVCAHKTRALAEAFAAAPVEWCPGCQEAAGVGEGPG